MACGRGFADYAPPVFTRAVRIAADQLYRYQAWSSQVEQGASDTEEPDKTFLIVALDLLSGLAQGLGLLARSSLLPEHPFLGELARPLQCLELCRRLSTRFGDHGRMRRGQGWREQV